MTARKKLLEIIARRHQVAVHELAQEMQVSRQLIHRLLNDYVKSGQIVKEGHPPKVVYRLADVKKQAGSLSRRELLKLKRTLLANDVKSVSLFGSFARGEAKAHSDIDLLIDLNKRATLFDLAAIKLDLEKTMSRPIDLVTSAALSPRLKDHIAKDLIKII